MRKHEDYSIKKACLAYLNTCHNPSLEMVATFSHILIEEWTECVPGLHYLSKVIAKENDGKENTTKNIPIHVPCNLCKCDIFNSIFTCQMHGQDKQPQFCPKCVADVGPGMLNCCPKKGNGCLKFNTFVKFKDLLNLSSLVCEKVKMPNEKTPAYK